MQLTDLVGHVGVACFLVAYFLLQKEKLSPTRPAYLGLNLAGAVLVMFSLLFAWNLPAFVLEAAWASISMYGIYKHVFRKRT